MTTTLRLMFSVLILLALSVPATFAVLLLEWSVELSGSVHDPDAPTESRREAGTHEKNYALIHCSEEKARVTELLLAGKISLVQAVEEFRRFNEELENARPSHAHFAIFHSDEALVESVMSWAASHVADRPEQTAILHQLEQERQRLYPQHDPKQTTLH